MTYITLFLTAFLLSLGIVPILRRFALKIKALERTSERKISRSQPVPLLGGLAIFIAFWLTLGNCLFLNKEAFGDFPVNFLGMFMGSLVILFSGVFDDLRESRPYLKLLMQMIAGWVLILSGFEIERINTPFGILDLGLASLPFTLFWILLLINAINLLDGLDGLSAGTVVIIALTGFFAGLRQKASLLSYLFIALGGASAGFIPFNFYPARIFMGDTGSMFLGYTLAAISILGGGKTQVGLSLIIPVLIMALPLLDTFYAIVRRLKKKRHIFSADMEHIHHKLLRYAHQNQRRTVLTLYFLSLCYGLFGISFADPKLKGIYAIGALVLLVFFTIRWLKNLVIG